MPDRTLLYAIAAVALLYIACKKPALGALLVVACFALVYVFPLTRETRTSSSMSPDVTARHSASIPAPPSVEPEAGAANIEEKTLEGEEMIPAHRNTQTGPKMEEEKEVQTIGAMRSHAEYCHPDYRSMNKYLDIAEDEMSLTQDPYMSYS